VATELSWLIGGPQGSGVESAANIFSRVCASLGYQIFGKREFYSNIKGEHSYFAVRISDKKITLAPGKKVIPKKEFETLKRASSILKEVKKEVISYKKSIAKESEILKEEAYKKGFEEGLVKLNKEILYFSKEVKSFTEEMKKKILPINLAVP